MATVAQGLPTDGQRVFSIRHKAGLSQTQMAERLGLSLRAYQEIEKSPDPRTAYVLAAEFIGLQLALERGARELATPYSRSIADQVAALRS